MSLRSCRQHAQLNERGRDKQRKISSFKAKKDFVCLGIKARHFKEGISKGIAHSDNPKIGRKTRTNITTCRAHRLKGTAVKDTSYKTWSYLHMRAPTSPYANWKGKIASWQWDMQKNFISTISLLIISRRRTQCNDLKHSKAPVRPTSSANAAARKLGL